MKLILIHRLCRLVVCIGSALVVFLAGSTALAQDNPWPKVLEGERGRIQIYQPQIESFAGNDLESRAALSVTPAGADAPIFGAMWFACELATDKEAGTATLERVRVTAARFPDMDQAKIDELSRYLEAEIPRWDLQISLANLAASLDGVVEPGGAGSLKNDPPAIHFRTEPAVLVLVDGDPIFTDLSDTDLRYVANSMFFIVEDPASRALFLRGAGMWFTATGLEGPWQMTADLPRAVAAISARVEQDEKDQAAAEQSDAENLALEADADEAPPEIIVSTVPAELIVTEGEPNFASVEGTQLLYLKNTESDVVMDIGSQSYHALISGRWYATKSLEKGPWRFVDFTDLPAEFAAIPPESDLGQVLAAVPGTEAARDAVLDTQIPQTAEVDRKSATCEVKYDGDPVFETCGEGVSYARNTDKSVLLIDGVYYCVDNAVWFTSGKPTGPWRVADAVPPAVQDLPADCPVYNVKYVYIYDVTPEVVYVGYTPGYYGYYVYGPCVVYGTGWTYRPWWGHTYYPRPVTYGFGVHYSPWTGWGFTYGMSYGWLHIGVGWGRPYYGCWGPAGYRYGYRHGYWHGYNHGYRRGAAAGYRNGYRAGYRAAQRQPQKNIYRERENGVRRTGDVGRQARNRPATSDRRNDVYSDRKGDVYRDKDGKWEKREDGNWKEDRSRDGSRDQARPQDRSQQDLQQLDRDRSSRQRGTDRQRQAPQRSAPRGGGRRR